LDARNEGPICRDRWGLRFFAMTEITERQDPTTHQSPKPPSHATQDSQLAPRGYRPSQNRPGLTRGLRSGPRSPSRGIRRQAWSLSNRHQDLVHGVAKTLQPSLLDHGFRNGMKYGNPRQSSAGMMISNPIAVLHLVALCADDCRPQQPYHDAAVYSGRQQGQAERGEHDLDKPRGGRWWPATAVRLLERCQTLASGFTSR
jgi:hypothetical protein